MSEGALRQWRLFIDDMIVCGERAAHYASEFDQADFFRSHLYVDATLRNLELNGEAAAHIPADMRNAHADVPWRQLIGPRNRLIHGYLGIDNDTMWSVHQDDRPALLEQLRSIRAT
jgi:uncharacterized protein with HEPN domain